MQKVEQFGIFEIKMHGCELSEEASLPIAHFKTDDTSFTVRGFIEGDGEAIVRFMPQQKGTWSYSAVWGSIKNEGSFECVGAAGSNHGPVRAAGCHFRYADGERYIPMGTTCYAWIHQPANTIKLTIESLKNAPFNKVRMCLFPKSMPFNQNEPQFFPFERKQDGNWDVERPVSEFWHNLENNIAKLCKLGIEADLILFHPYDRWGLSKLSRDENLKYLDYCIRRLAAYRNIWWSLANEYDLVFSKTLEDWDKFGSTIAANDPYAHLISVHNWIRIYPKRTWLSHVSLQKSDISAAFKARDEYMLPVVVDECGYEGNISFDWGNISAFEMVNRMWTAISFGCYATHGETFYREDEVLWWAKGGELHGQSPLRIAFLRDFLAGLPGPMEPYASTLIRDPNASVQSPEHAALMLHILNEMGDEERNQIIRELTKPIGRHPNYRLQYLGRSCSKYIDLTLPENGLYCIEAIDVWEMKRNTVLENACGSVRAWLPGKEGIAVLITRISGQDL